MQQSIKTCVRMINTIFRVVLTSEEGGNGLTDGKTTASRMFYFLKCFFFTRAEENTAKINTDAFRLFLPVFRKHDVFRERCTHFDTIRKMRGEGWVPV